MSKCCGTFDNIRSATGINSNLTALGSGDWDISKSRYALVALALFSATSLVGCETVNDETVPNMPTAQLCDLLGPNWITLPSERASIYRELERRGESCSGKYVRAAPTERDQTKPVPGGSDPNKVVFAASGSGFSVSSNGHVITNYHVIEGCQNVRIHHKGKSIPATVVTVDPRNDLALLKGNFHPSTVFPLNTKKLELLQDVYVAGFPFGQKVSTPVKVTKGIISSLTGIGNNFSNFQIDAALQSGNSGGPILDDRGNVLGVAVARLDEIWALKKFGSLPENINFGIKTSVVKSILESSNVSLPSPKGSSISKSKLAKTISDGTYYLSCWMTSAQIEKMRSKKVIFQNLD